MSILSSLKAALAGFYHRHVVRYTIARGQLQPSGTACTLLIAARGTPYKNYYLHRVFGGPVQETDTRWTLTSLLERTAARQRADFAIVELPLGSKDWVGTLRSVRIPKLVRQTIDISGDLADMKRRFRTRNRTTFNRFATKNPFSIRISRDPTDLNHFYHRMFVPHLHRQFGNAAVVDSYEDLRDVFSKGFLLLVNSEGIDIAAALCTVKDNAMIYYRGGVLDADEQYVERGAQTAMYVHMMLHARSLGLAQLNLGTSLPFFGDGVYHHKRSWGAAVSVHEWDDTDLQFLVPGQDAVFMEFLRLNPFIAMRGGQLVACCADDTAGAADAQDEAAAQATSSLDAIGLAGICLVRSINQPPRFVPLRAHKEAGASASATQAGRA